MQIIRYLIQQNGGMKKLDPYLMDSFILGDKYLAICKFAKPILPFDWDPGAFPRWAKGFADIDIAATGQYRNKASVFFKCSDILPAVLLSIINDILECLRVAQCPESSKRAEDPEIERWLYLRHQAFIYRLLYLPALHGTFQECVRISLIIWLCKVTPYDGAARMARLSLPRLQTALSTLNHDCFQDESLVQLCFWSLCLGAMTGEAILEGLWFRQQVLLSAKKLRIGITETQFRRVFETYLILESEDSQLCRLMKALAGMEQQIYSLLVLKHCEDMWYAWFSQFPHH